ncbi:MAG: terminase small subunit [Brevundimonas sp.]|uniref:terminase small subunit n=1 Tax=Brevundimonas sp. TaxID=1871086 RepID=UPI0025C2A524|nr:terminase small subunit [Brevundimonas sp.]MBX3476691.1 terminase small subunit [Brevundimonas sp.]
MISDSKNLPPDIMVLLGLDSGSPEAVADAPRPVTPTADEAVSAAISGAGVSAAELSDWIGVGARRINQLVADGVIKRVGRGRYDLQDSVRRYCQWVSDRASRGVAVQDDLKIENTRKAKAAADKAELQNARMRGELVHREEVARTWSGVVREVRAALLAVPARVADRLNLSRSDADAVDREVRDALINLAEAGADD